MTSTTSWLDSVFQLRHPSRALEELLALRHGRHAMDLLQPLIIKPIDELLCQPGKNIRGRLVEMGFRLTGGEGDTKICRLLSQAIETLHAGSLVIDDLQDGSEVRRGHPALHIKHGLPLAITIGNAMYFWPLEAIRSMKLPAEKELALYQIYHRTLLRAHLGQTIDVGVPVDTLPQDRIWDVCLASMELKSGALFSLGLLMGGVIAEGSKDWLEALDQFGHGFGMGLQMYDDLGNVKGKVRPEKQWEDLILRRPTWVWACAARYYSADVFRDFVAAASQLPVDTHPLQTWFDTHDFHHKAKSLAHQHMSQCFDDLEKHVLSQKKNVTSLRSMRHLADEIANAYE